MGSEKAERLSLSLALGVVFPFVVCPPTSIFLQVLVKCLLC